jgi:hypothetical protein
MPEIDGYSDDQEQSEVYDETHIDDEGDRDILPDEADPVLDVTQADGDADEVELVYSGLMRNARGAQASAAHWEAKRLSDDDIAGLGYGPDGDEDHPAK